MGQRPEVARGFTLLELIITLAVLAVAMAVVTPAIGRGTESLRARAEVAGFAATLRHAREQAITTQRSYRVVVDTDARKISVSTLPGQDPMSISQPRPSGQAGPRSVTSPSDSSWPNDSGDVLKKTEVNETRAISSRLVVEALQGSEVIFDTRGGANGGDFKLTAGDIVYRVTVDRLTGRVRSSRE